MPIKPENRNRYPKDWLVIRRRILERAGNCCEQCNVPNRVTIARGTGSDAGTYMDSDACVYSENDGTYLGRCRMSDYEVGRMVDIVLTVAHLDHTPEHCDDDNLRALCQQCHLRYDSAHHVETARATRRNRLAVADLFSTEEGGG